jgi:hypothetical protein
MAGNKMPRLYLLQDWNILITNLFGIVATRMETTARRRLNEIRDVPGNNSQNFSHIQPGNSGK